MVFKVYLIYKINSTFSNLISNLWKLKLFQKFIQLIKLLKYYFFSHLFYKYIFFLYHLDYYFHINHKLNFDH